MSAKWILAALTIAFAITAQMARAHESRPLYIEISERQGGVFAMQWRTPASVPRDNLPDVALPECEPATPLGTTRSASGPVSQRLYRCDAGLTDATLEIKYPVLNPSVSTLLRINWLSGETRSVLASPKESTIALPAPETTAGVAVEYLIMGVEHILTGYDHLLFVACLILIAGSWRRILITITGFTIAHSITLALAALDLVRVPVPPVEAAIALSIVLLATEIARQRRDTLTWRYPIAVAGSFGLLHGFGFASVLGEIGLPQTEVPAALLFFNVGVEIGQIVFVAALLAVMIALGSIGLLPRNTNAVNRFVIPPAFARPTAYAVGALATFWMIERVAGFVA